MQDTYISNSTVIQQQLDSILLFTYITVMSLSQLSSRAISKIVHPASSPRWGGTVTVVDPSYSDIDPFIFLVHHGKGCVMQ